jgi:RimJ/RimL family protein N-acetyltransferase
MMENLVSGRLELRPIELDDKYQIYAYRSDSEVSRYQSWKPKTIEEVHEFISTKIQREPNILNTWMQFAICTRADHKLVGDCGIHFLENDSNQVEIGITISKQNQGMGYGAETLSVIFDYIFLNLGKHRIIASADPKNTASIKLLEKMKMRKEAHFIKSICIDGEWVDDVIYAILAIEWLGKR